MLNTNCDGIDNFNSKKINGMKYLCLLICLALRNCLKAQSADDSVRSAVNQLFTAMKNLRCWFPVLLTAQFFKPS
jgi:hypothetical protein